MEAIRHIITPNSKTLEITLPEDMVHEELEVIILRIKIKEMKNEGSIGYQSQKEKLVKEVKVGETSQVEARWHRGQKGKLSKEEAKRMLAYVEESRREWL